MNENNKTEKVTVGVSIDDAAISKMNDLGVDVIAEVAKSINKDVAHDGRRVFHVDVGNLSSDDAQKVIEELKKPRTKYVSTKTYGAERGFAVAYRQWRADSHCNMIHGYAMGFHFEFESYELDVRNWVVDFGSLKSLKEKLDEWFDHTCLVAQDDPEFALFEEMHKRKLIKMVVVERTGCEGLATFLADYINDIWMEENGYAGRVKLRKVEVRETPSNSAMWLAE